MERPDNLIPFILPAAVVDGTRMGRGIIRIVPANANTDVTIVHTLGRIPAFVVPLDNGTTYVPRVRRSTSTAWTTATVTVEFDTACPAPGATLWIV